MSERESFVHPSGERRRTANPGLAFLVCLAWYGAIVMAFLWYADQQSRVVPKDCDDSFCISDRDGMLIFGIFAGGPTLFVSLLVSIGVLGLLAAKTHIRSAVVLGSLAVSPALLPVTWFVVSVLR